MDRYRCNWLASYFEKLSPNEKRILVDKKDEEIFKALYSQKAKNIVAVVNQWHMEGIEHHWRHSTGTQLTVTHQFIEV
jgi:pheromone shutdown protein TraB